MYDYLALGGAPPTHAPSIVQKVSHTPGPGPGPGASFELQVQVGEVGASTLESNLGSDAARLGGAATKLFSFSHRTETLLASEIKIK